MNVAFTVINTLVGLLLILMISKSNLPLIRIGKLTKIGLWVGAIGLISQALRTGFMVHFGNFPFQDAPIWMLKDLGYWFIAAGLLLHLYEKIKERRGWHV